MSVPSPFEDPDAWNAVTVLLSKNGKSEKWEWSETEIDFDGDVTNDWDVKKPKGADSARTTDEGYVPAKFSLSVLLCAPEHFRAYESIVQAARPRPGKEPKPVVIVIHPLLQLYSLTMCRLEKIHFLNFKGVDQWLAKFDLLEWTPDPPKQAKTSTPKVRQPTSFVRDRNPTSFVRDRDPVGFVRDRSPTGFQRDTDTGPTRPALPSGFLKP